MGSDGITLFRDVDWAMLMAFDGGDVWVGSDEPDDDHSLPLTKLSADEVADALSSLDEMWGRLTRAQRERLNELPSHRPGWVHGANASGTRDVLLRLGLVQREATESTCNGLPLYGVAHTPFGRAVLKRAKGGRDA